MSESRSTPTQAGQLYRVRAFVDFWNFQISVNSCYPRDTFRLDWRALGSWFTQQAGGLIGANHTDRVTYEGLHVYLSYNPRVQKDTGLKKWAINTLDQFPGVEVSVFERRQKQAPRCPACQTQLTLCPSCQTSLSGTVEKGVDTAIVTDMIRLAWTDSYDVAVLVSSDADFIPAVQFLRTKGIKVINGRFKPRGMDLSRECWASLDLANGLPSR